MLCHNRIVCACTLSTFRRLCQGVVSTLADFGANHVQCRVQTALRWLELEGVRWANCEVPAASKPAGRQQSVADAWPRLDEELTACLRYQQLHSSRSGRPARPTFLYELARSCFDIPLTTFRPYNTVQSMYRFRVEDWH